MSRGRSENELAVGLGANVDRLTGLVERHQLARGNRLGNRKAARGERDPRDVVSRRRLVTPDLAGPQSDREIIDRRRCFERTRHAAVASKQHRDGPARVDVLGLQIDAFRRSELLVGWQSEPQLEAAAVARLPAAATMPGTARSLEPFDPASGQEARSAGRVLVTHVAFPQISQRREARMWVPTEARKGRADAVEKFAEPERLEPAAKVGRAHQPGDWTVGSAEW